MIFKDLQTALTNSHPDAKLQFVFGETHLANGFHVTEVKLAQIASLDCGAGQDNWTEVRLQIMATQSGDMTAGTAASIIRQAARSLPGAEHSQVVVEYDPGDGMRLFSAAKTKACETSLSLSLTPSSATCKASARFQRLQILPKSQADTAPRPQCC